MCKPYNICMNQFERNEILLGADSTAVLKNAAVAVFGLGGVGGSLAEALARAGIGQFLLVDFDTVSVLNINRQAVALHSTLGRFKADCMAEKIRDINPAAAVTVKKIRVGAQNINEIDFTPYDYIADAVDDVAAKIEIIKKAKAENKKIISCMGAGNRTRVAFAAADISKTYGCPLAKKVRAELKNLGISGVKAVFCPVLPQKETASTKNPSENNCVPQHGNVEPNGSIAKIIGSVSFIPPAAGLFMAGEIILDLLNI